MYNLRLKKKKNLNILLFKRWKTIDSELEQTELHHINICIYHVSREL